MTREDGASAEAPPSGAADHSMLTRRAVLRGAAAAGAASLARPGAGIAALASRGPGGVFSRWVGTVAGESQIAAPGRFALVGVEWAEPAHVTIELRTRVRDGAWGPWAVASVLGHGPDRAPRPRRSLRRTDLERTGRLRPAAQLSNGVGRAPAFRGRASLPAAGTCGAGVPTGPAGARRGPWPAADHRSFGVGRGTCAAQPRPAVRHGQARVRPSQRDAERLRPRRRSLDPPVDLRLPPLRPGLFRHRLQLRGRRVRPDLGGASRRHRPADRRRARRRLQRGVGRHGGARLVHGRRALAGGDRRADAAAGLEALASRRPRSRSRYRRGGRVRRLLHAVRAGRARLAAAHRRPPRRRSDELPRQCLLRPASLDATTGRPARGLAGARHNHRAGGAGAGGHGGRRGRAADRRRERRPARRRPDRAPADNPPRRADDRHAHHRRRRELELHARTRRERPPASAPPAGAGGGLGRRRDRGRADRDAHARLAGAARCQRQRVAAGTPGDDRPLQGCARAPAPGHEQARPGARRSVPRPPAEPRVPAATS